MSSKAARRTRQPVKLRRAKPGPPIAGIAALVVVLLALVGLVAIKVVSGGGSGGGNAQDNQPVPATVLAALTQTPAATFDAVGKGGVTLLPTAASGQPLKSADGKPELLYVGAEYCPYCAAQRWSVIMALSRFGTWSGLRLMTSSATDVYPSTPTFTFAHATYSSPYLAFTSVELTTNRPNGSGGYQPLQSMTAEQKQLFNTYDAPPYIAASSAGSIPFLDLANRYVQAGAAVNPQVLHGMDWQQVAQALGQPSTPPAQGIVGGANALTAAICAVDGNQPAAVCTSKGVQQVQLGAAS